jgi:hypothetical protein
LLPTLTRFPRVPPQKKWQATVANHLANAIASTRVTPEK